MKTRLRRQVERVSARLGYQIVRANAGPKTVSMSFEDFSLIVRCYEQLLNRVADGRPIVPNELRPKLLSRLIGTSVTEAYFIVQALAETSDVRGDVCEFGVAQGETSALIANEIRGRDKVLHLYDSFAGLPAPTEKDRLKDDILGLGSIEAYAGTMSSPEELVRARLAAVDFPESRYVIHKGMIEYPIRADETNPEHVSCAYVDFDFYEPIRAALEYLHEVTGPGARIVVDDYDFFSTGAKTAVDEFVAARNGYRREYDIEVPDETFGHFAVLARRG
jgi:hypothetical protein